MSYTFYQMLSIFFVFGFLGWTSEVIYAALMHGRFVNRGFLMGPICPIYGIGVLLVVSLLEPFYDRPVLVFIFSSLICSAVELLIGFVSEKLLHQRLWDYSTRFMNIGGYVCLLFSLLWGFACLAVVYFLQPLAMHLVMLIPHTLGLIILALLSCLILTDAALTLFHALHLNARMKAIDELSRAISSVSEHIGENVSDGAIHLKEKVEEDEALQQRYKELVNSRNLVHEHLFLAFSNLREGKYKSAYERIRDAQRKREHKS